MTISVDLDARTITAAIRDLAESPLAGPRGLGLLARARAALGQQVHEAYRRERELSRPGFRAEVPVRLDLVVDGFRAEIKGRIDGVLETADRWTIEEVKSVALGGSELAHADAEIFPDFARQLRLYGLALATDQPDRPLAGRLILVSLLDGTRHEMVVDLAPEETRRALIEQLRDQISEAEWRRTRARRLAALAEELRFPYPELRPHQDTLLAEFEDGLAASRPVLALAPTGIGKTVAALLGGLRHALRQDAHLFFLTAKTTQQSLVESTFAALCAATPGGDAELRCLTLRAKERMCLTGTLLCHPEVCPYLKDFASRLGRSEAQAQALAAGPQVTPEVVRAVGEAHRLCPFSLSLALAPQVNVIIGDYNYVYDPGIALGTFFGDEARHKAVVVVDEAHNLFDRARGYYSPRITRTELQELRQRLGRGEFLATDDADDAQEALPGTLLGVDGPQLFDRLARLCNTIERSLARTQVDSEAEEIPAIDDCRPTELDLAEWERLADQTSELAVLYAVYNRAHRLVRHRDPVVDLLARITRIRDVLCLEQRVFVPYVAGLRASDGPAVGILCVNPAGQLARRHRQVVGTVAMSATLIPQPYYADVLGFEPFDPLVLNLPSPFPRENLGAWITPSVSTTYRERDRYRKTIAAIIRATVEARPGRYAAYFPSYAFLDQVRPLLGLDPATVLVQGAGLSVEARADLLEGFRTGPAPRLLLAVMGGVFAEGVDLPGEALVGAIVVSPGLPQIGFERAQMRQYFDEQDEGKGFAYAMLYPGLQRVIQAAGRVIRSDRDRGVIVLVGRRFAQEQVTACLPEHWYRYDPAELLATDLRAHLAEFWADLEPPG